LELCFLWFVVENQVVVGFTCKHQVTSAAEQLCGGLGVALRTRKSSTLPQCRLPAQYAHKVTDERYGLQGMIIII
jgi:hypothetical protein